MSDPASERGTAASWLTFFHTQCPVLYRLITDRTGNVDQKAVERILERYGPPCNPDTTHCLERQCSALWQYYVSTRHKRPAVPAEVQNIADHLFAERGNRSFRPGELTFLYDLRRSTTDDRRDVRVVRRSGETVLRVEEDTTAEAGNVQSYDIMRILQLEHPDLTKYFVPIYALERSVTTPVRLYLLLQAMEGSLTDFKREFAPRDPHFWHRFTRMLLHAWMGVYRLHALGYALGHVCLDNILFQLEWHAGSPTAGLLAVKWRCPRTLSDQTHRQRDDWVQFARMICELLWGAADCPDRQSELQQPNHLQPLSGWAGRFLAATDDPGWTPAQMCAYLVEHAPSRTVLPALPLEPPTEMYSDW